LGFLFCKNGTIFVAIPATFAAKMVLSLIAKEEKALCQFADEPTLWINSKMMTPSLISSGYILIIFKKCSSV